MKNKRIRRQKSERQSIIEISAVEFDLLIAYVNIISENLKDHMTSVLKHNLTVLACPNITKQKIDKRIMNGEEKISNLLVFVLTMDNNDDSWQDAFLNFAKEHRYLNTSIKTDCGTTCIKLENSDKYQYFNIEASSKENAKSIYFKIECRRLFKIVDKGSLTKRFTFKTLLKNI